MHSTILALVAAAGLTTQLAKEGEPIPEKPDASGWIPLFDGKTLSGWSTFDAGVWKIDSEGSLVGDGKRSHLFSPSTYTNLQFKAEAKLNHFGNSGMYFRAVRMPGWPRGYEAQVENTSPDPKKTGSLYNFVPISQQLVQDDTWWTQEIIAVGNRIIIQVNGKTTVDFIDEKKSFLSGHLAFQQHNQGSVVHYRNVKVKRLPADEKEAWEMVHKEHPEIPLKKEG